MRMTFVDVPVVGCELELDERDPSNIRKAVRVDLGNGISTRFALDAPGVNKLGVGVLVTGEVELSSSGITPWNIPAEEGSNMPARSGHTLKGVILKELKAGEQSEKIVPKLEEKNWSEMTPTRTRAAFTPRAPQAPAAGTKTGGDQEEQVADTIE